MPSDSRGLWPDREGPVCQECLCYESPVQYKRQSQLVMKNRRRTTLTPRTRIARFIFGHILIAAGVFFHPLWSSLGALLILGAVLNYCPVEYYFRSSFKSSAHDCASGSGLEFHSMSEPLPYRRQHKGGYAGLSAEEHD